MGKRGPKPQAPALKLVKGNPGKRPIEMGVQVEPGIPPEPDWKALFPGSRKGVGDLRKDAKREWDRITPILDRQGLLTQLDWAVAMDYCVCIARLLECERVISIEGLEKWGSRGLMKHPAISSAAGYRAQLKSYIGELGLGPSSRGSMKSPGEGPDEEGILDA